jgi:hypothetical protein
MGLLEKGLIKIVDCENRSQAILSACENPNDPFPSCAEEYDIAAYLYNFYSKDNESYHEKAYFNALQAIIEGYHTSQDLYIVADYLSLNKNLIGLKQLFRLVCSIDFCYCHTPNAGQLQVELRKSINEISLEEHKTGDPIFTKVDVEKMLGICRSHREIISTWERLKKQEEWGMKHAYAGVCDARRELYYLHYCEVNLSSPPGAEKPYFEELKSSIFWSKRFNIYKK